MTRSDHFSSIFLLGNLYLGGGFKTKTLELYANAIYYAGEDQQVKIQMQAEIQRIKAMKYNEKMTTVYYSISGCEF